MTRKRLTQAVIKEMRKMRKSGKSNAEIAKKFGVAHSTVSYHTLRKSKAVRREYNKQYRKKQTLPGGVQVTEIPADTPKEKGLEFLLYGILGGIIVGGSFGYLIASI